MEAVSIRAIVNEVGVSPPALYLHFEDKDDLFFAVCERRFADFDKVLEAAAEGIDDPVDRLRALGMAYARYGLDHAEQYQILFGPDAPGNTMKSSLDADSAGMKAMGLLIEAVTEAMESGRFRPGDVMLTAMTIWSAVHGLVMLYLYDPAGHAPVDMPAAELVQQNVCDVVLRGLIRD